MAAGVEPPKQQGQGEVSQSQPRESNKPLSLPWTLWLRRSTERNPYKPALPGLLLQADSLSLEAMPLSHTLDPPHLLKTPELETL